MSRLVVTVHTTSADLIMNVAKLHLIFEGSNNKR